MNMSNNRPTRQQEEQAEQTIVEARQLLDIFSQVIDECPRCSVKVRQRRADKKQEEAYVYTYTLPKTVNPVLCQGAVYPRGIFK